MSGIIDIDGTRLCEPFRLTEAELSYLIRLVEIDRALAPPYNSRLLDKLRRSAQTVSGSHHE